MDFAAIFQDQLETVRTHSALPCIAALEPDILFTDFFSDRVSFSGENSGAGLKFSCGGHTPL